LVEFPFFNYWRIGVKMKKYGGRVQKMKNNNRCFYKIVSGMESRPYKVYQDKTEMMTDVHKFLYDENKRLADALFEVTFPTDTDKPPESCISEGAKRVWSCLIATYLVGFRVKWKHSARVVLETSLKYLDHDARFVVYAQIAAIYFEIKDGSNEMKKRFVVLTADIGFRADLKKGQIRANLKMNGKDLKFIVADHDRFGTYEGRVVLGKPEGQGIYTCGCGDKSQKAATSFSGTWSDGRFINGTIVYSDGKTYIGPVSHFKPHTDPASEEAGVMIYSDGRQQTGKWEKGKLVLQEALTLLSREVLPLGQINS
jgi:hypothetical protein